MKFKNISDLEFRKSLDGLQWPEDTQYSQRFDGLNVASFVIPVQKDRQCEHHCFMVYYDHIFRHSKICTPDTL